MVGFTLYAKRRGNNRGNKADNRFGQAVWVTLVAMPAILINIAPTSQAALGVKDLIGVGVWAAGFGLEIIADRRK